MTTKDAVSFEDLWNEPYGLPRETLVCLVAGLEYAAEEKGPLSTALAGLLENASYALSNRGSAEVSQGKVEAVLAVVVSGPAEVQEEPRLREWQVVLSEDGQHVTTVHGYTEDEARERARDVLDRGGRRLVLRKWTEAGCLLREKH